MKKISFAIILFFLISIVFLKSALAETTKDELMTEINSLKERINQLEKQVNMLQDQRNTVKAETSSDKKGLIEIEKVPRGAEREKSYEPGSDVYRKEKSFIEIEKVPRGAEREKHYEPGSDVHEKDADLIIGVDATFIGQGTPNANNAGDSEDSRFDGSWSSDVLLEKEFSDWGKALVHLEVGQGEGLETELSLFSNVNADVMSSSARIEVTEAWYSQWLLDRQLAISGGKLNFRVYFDQNNYANDETIQFLSHMFKNSPAIEFPSDNTLGVNAYLKMKSIDFIELNLGYFDANTDWNNIFDNGFYMAQINIIPSEILEIDKKNWNGNYRFYGWINDLNHDELVKGGISDTKNKELNYGFGISFDQMLTDVYGVFTRFGWQRPNVLPSDGGATLEWSWSAGAQMKGVYWRREDDVLAFAVGQLFPSSEWKDSSDTNFGSAEGHLELYYKCVLNKHLAISPDFQFIWNPDGISKSSDGDNDPIFVYGIRAQVDF